jgi:catechol 2,3-dioxygenase-like lactoylglutathione lyase family enzyme
MNAHPAAPDFTRLAHVPEPKAAPRPREYAHVVFRTTQPEAMIDWYCAVLGMQVVVRTPLINFLTWDGSQDRLAIMAIPQFAIDAARARGGEAAPIKLSGVDHVAFTYDRLADVVAVYRAVAAKAIAPHWCINHGVATSMYFKDPDGNVIELSVENFPDVDSLNAWLATGDFNRNPIGVTLDPEDLARRVEAGEAEADILRPHPDHASAFAAELKRVGLTPDRIGA